MRGSTSLRLADHEFRNLVEEVRQRHNLSDVVRSFGHELRAGRREHSGLCPFHDERRPSFYVNDAKGSYHCHGCLASGDVFSFVQAQIGGGMWDALRWLAGSDLPQVSEADRSKRERISSDSELSEISDANAFWNECVGVAGTPAEVYLREVRSIACELPDTIRFGHVPRWRDKVTGNWSDRWPALVCGVFDSQGDLTAIQRIFLKPDGRGKADMDRPKLNLGRVRGGSMRFGLPQETIFITEGPEDGLTIAQQMPGQSVWPTLGTSMMPHVVFPPLVSEIVICAQNDPAGAKGAVAAAEAMLDRGYAVRTVFPDERFKDWNDELRGIEQ